MDELSYLSKLGKAVDELKTTGKTPVGEVARLFAQEMIDLMKSKVPVANGSLKQSIGFNFSEEDGRLIIKFLADDYWDFVNSGVDGTRGSAGSIVNQFGSVYKFKTENPSPSMVEAFGGGANYGKNGEQGNMQNWMASKGIIADNGNYNSLAFALAKMTKMYGIKPTPFVNESITSESFERFEQDLLKAFKEII